MIERIIGNFNESANLKLDVAELLAPAIASAADQVLQCVLRDGKVLACGNGGSAADAQHFSSEMVNRFELDRPGLAAIALTTDTSTLTSIANDIAYEQVFARQVSALGHAGDVATVVDDLVAAVQHRITDWGSPGQGLFWKPLLQVQVAYGGESAFVALQQLLEGSGLALQCDESPAAPTSRASPSGAASRGSARERTASSPLRTSRSCRPVTCHAWRSPSARARSPARAPPASWTPCTSSFRRTDRCGAARGRGSRPVRCDGSDRCPDARCPRLVHQARGARRGRKSHRPDRDLRPRAALPDLPAAAAGCGCALRSSARRVASLRARPENRPAAEHGGRSRTRRTRAYDAESDRVILYGNTSGLSMTGETWAYDFNSDTWAKMKARGPLGHLGLRIAYDVESDRIILFGGYNVNSDEVHQDTWAYDFNSDSWVEMKPAVYPPGQNFHSMTYDSGADRVILWGGDTETGSSRPPKDPSVWAYDYNTNFWGQKLTDNGPGARVYGAMAYDTSSDQIILYGGYTIGSNEMWSYNYDANTWTKLESSVDPGKLSRHDFVYVPVIDRFILFGGQLGIQEFTYGQSTWIYDLNANTWINVTQHP